MCWRLLYEISSSAEAAVISLKNKTVCFYRIEIGENVSRTIGIQKIYCTNADDAHTPLKMFIGNVS